ncbi:hypothetical protein [Streptomyces sp. NPDC001635]
MSADQLFTGPVLRMDARGSVTGGRVRWAISASSGTWADVGAPGGIGYASGSKALLRPQAVAA